jgi:hypothetical protein
VVLWILMIIALIVSIFAFEMQLESKMITLQRARFKADQLALAGVELAKAMLLYKEDDETKGPTGERLIHEDSYLNEAAKIADGVPVHINETFGDGTVRLNIDFEKGRRLVKTLEPLEWKEIFDQAGIPNTDWDSLLDCLEDWQDEGDEHRLNGAESDDPFYKKRGYECKNAPVDTVDELLLIKGWTPEILYGTPPDEEVDTPITGIAKMLTTWGDDKTVNPNSAIREVLNSLKISDADIDAIIEARLGSDGEKDTADDGITEADIASLGLDAGIFSVTPDYVTITSIGEVGGVQSRISCIFQFKLGGKEAVPLFWLEGK